MVPAWAQVDYLPNNVSGGHIRAYKVEGGCAEYSGVQFNGKRVKVEITSQRPQRAPLMVSSSRAARPSPSWAVGWLASLDGPLGPDLLPQQNALALVLPRGPDSDA